MTNPEALVETLKHESLGLVAGVAVIGALYFVMLRLTAPKAA
jgi:hypothetical protein